MDRIYCKDCKHYEDYFYDDVDNCQAEPNRIYNPNYRANYYKLIRHPKKINQFGDCKWYEPKKGNHGER